MNKRMRDICLMFKYITGLSIIASSEIILKTVTGRSIEEENVTVMYEQQTENLYSIIYELQKIEKYKSLAALFSVEKIVKAMYAVVINQSAKHSDRTAAQYNMQARSRFLLKKKQNLIIGRRNLVC